MLASREYTGGPKEQQDGHEGVWNRIFIDFGLIRGPYFESFLGTEVCNLNLFSVFSMLFVYRFVSRNLDAWGFSNQVFVQKLLQNTFCSQKSFFVDSRVNLCHFFVGLEDGFADFYGLGDRLET